MPATLATNVPGVVDVVFSVVLLDWLPPGVASSWGPVLARDWSTRNW